MESALQATYAVLVKTEPPDDVCAQNEPSCEVVAIKIEPSCVKDEPMRERVSFEMKLEDVCVKQEPSKTDGAAAAGVYAGRLENKELVLEPVRGPEPAVERRIAAALGQTPKDKSSANTKIFKCAYCTYETVNLLWLIRHTKTHSDKKSSNKSRLGCNKKSSKKSRSGVQKKHQTVETFKCGRIYAGTSKISLQHDVKLYKCNQCSFACTQKDDLLLHKIVHTVKPGNTQRNLQELERKDTNENTYKCSYCSASFLQEVTWQVHERRHTGEKPFKCDQCSYAGTQINHLLSHKAMHTNVISYKCSQCDFACGKKDDLINHKVIHMNDQPFKCRDCSFSTDRKCHLRVHRATHTGAAIYKCSTCDYVTIRQKDLANHEARHAVKRYKCEICSFACNRQFQLKHHERIHDEELKKRIQETQAHNLRNYLSIQKDSAEDQPPPPSVPVQDEIIID
ncbi:zinc finger protein 98-like [Cydia fagiglandana]|uniref:zinc finger protein 98-like n=1 Tax=Cydia fagiglandana TaxID=1458189 RepID=UPI002FEE23A9